MNLSLPTLSQDNLHPQQHELVVQLMQLTALVEDLHHLSENIDVWTEQDYVVCIGLDVNFL